MFGVSPDTLAIRTAPLAWKVLLEPPLLEMHRTSKVVNWKQSVAGDNQETLRLFGTCGMAVRLVTTGKLPVCGEEENRGKGEGDEG